MKENSFYVRGVWVPYGAETINEMYGMEGQKHESKYKKIADNPNREKIARKSTDGKVKWGQGRGEKNIIKRGDLTEEAKVWFYFMASVMVPTKHVCTVREQKAIILYAMMKGYKLNAGAIIENSIMRYHEGDKRGLIPHPATITRLCLRAGVKGSWDEEEECPKVSPLTLTGVSKESKEKGGYNRSRIQRGRSECKTGRGHPSGWRSRRRKSRNTSRRGHLYCCRGQRTRG